MSAINERLSPEERVVWWHRVMGGCVICGSPLEYPTQTGFRNLVRRSEADSILFRYGLLHQLEAGHVIDAYLLKIAAKIQHDIRLDKLGLRADLGQWTDAQRTGLMRHVTEADRTMVPVCKECNGMMTRSKSEALAVYHGMLQRAWFQDRRIPYRHLSNIRDAESNAKTMQTIFTFFRLVPQVAPAPAPADPTDPAEPAPAAPAAIAPRPQPLLVLLQRWKQQNGDKKLWLTNDFVSNTDNDLRKEILKSDSTIMIKGKPWHVTGFRKENNGPEVVVEAKNPDTNPAPPMYMKGADLMAYLEGRTPRKKKSTRTSAEYDASGSESDADDDDDDDRDDDNPPVRAPSAASSDDDAPAPDVEYFAMAEDAALEMENLRVSDDDNNNATRFVWELKSADDVWPDFAAVKIMSHLMQWGATQHSRHRAIAVFWAARYMWHSLVPMLKRHETPFEVWYVHVFRVYYRFIFPRSTWFSHDALSMAQVTNAYRKHEAGVVGDGGVDRGWFGWVQRQLALFQQDIQAVNAFVFDKNASLLRYAPLRAMLPDKARIMDSIDLIRETGNGTQPLLELFYTKLGRKGIEDHFAWFLFIMNGQKNAHDYVWRATLELDRMFRRQAQPP